MLATGWTPDVVAALSPERRERLLWNIRARRLVEIRDRRAAAVVTTPEALQLQRVDLNQIDVLLFPGSIPAPTSGG